MKYLYLFINSVLNFLHTKHNCNIPKFLSENSSTPGAVVHFTDSVTIERFGEREVFVKGGDASRGDFNLAAHFEREEVFNPKYGDDLTYL
jgi:hypothetical protein